MILILILFFFFILDIISPCWGFPGQQQQLRAFASAFGHQRPPFLDPRACSMSPLSSAEWRLAAKSQAEQWALQAAVAVADLPRRLPPPSQGK